MTWISPLTAITFVAVACGQPSSSTKPIEDTYVPEVTMDAATPKAAAPSVDAAFITVNHPVDAGPQEPEVTLTPSKDWPFFAWDKAQSYTFNQTRPGPGAKLRVYSQDQGWTRNPGAGPILSPSQSKKALALLAKTQGELIVSKCPFPRHGIVFFQNDVPVGSISVCFECGDIMIWPSYSQASDWDERKQKRFRKLMKAYDRVFPRWERLFEDELKLPTDWKKLPTSSSR